MHYLFKSNIWKQIAKSKLETMYHINPPVLPDTQFSPVEAKQ